MASVNFCYGVIVMIRFLLTVVFGLLALAAQLLVLVLLMPGFSGEQIPLSTVCVWQLLAAVCAGVFFACMPADKSAAWRRGLFTQTVLLCLFLPVGGQLLLLSMRAAPALFPASRRFSDIHIVPLPEYSPRTALSGTHRTAAQLKKNLANITVEEAERVAAMIALRNLPLHYTAGVLQGLLSDPQEEVRLLAYGISSGAESAVSQKIQQASRQLECAVTASEKAHLSAELAELHWELRYQNLVQGELARHALQRVELYAHASLALDQSNAAMWCLLGRLALAKDEPLLAEFFFLHARKRGYSELCVFPWLAEAAFKRGEYGLIKAMMRDLKDYPLPPALQPVMLYWTS